jgi:hypothetical protein
MSKAIAPAGTSLRDFVCLKIASYFSSKERIEKFFSPTGEYKLLTDLFGLFVFFIHIPPLLGLLVLRSGAHYELTILHEDVTWISTEWLLSA